MVFQKNVAVIVIINLEIESSISWNRNNLKQYISNFVQQPSGEIYNTFLGHFPLPTEPKTIFYRRLNVGMLFNLSPFFIENKKFRGERGGETPHQHQFFTEHMQSSKVNREKVWRIINICCRSYYKYLEKSLWIECYHKQFYLELLCMPTSATTIVIWLKAEYDLNTWHSKAKKITPNETEKMSVRLGRNYNI